MPLYDGFTNLQTMSKTLRFELQPVGNTQDIIDEQEMLKEDFERSEYYPMVKRMIDEEHKKFIDAALAHFHFSDRLKEYAEVYETQDKDSTRSKKLNDLSAVLRKEILNALKNHEDYKTIKSPADLIKNKLLIEKQGKEKEALEIFAKFAMYFTGLQEARNNLYTDEEKSTAVPYRAINDNLPKFLDNIRSFRKISAVPGITKYFETMEQELALGQFSVRDFFTVDFYSFAVMQESIEQYNMLIGGKKTENEKQIIKGLNQYINLYNQTHDKSERLPMLKPLYKQILSDRESLSFIPEKFEDDNELLQSIRSFYEERFSTDAFINLFECFNEFNLSGIYIKNNQNITDISQKVFGDWGIVSRSLGEKFDRENTKKFRDEDKYDKARNTYIKSHESISVSTLEEMAQQSGKIGVYIKDTVHRQIETISKCYSDAKELLSSEYPKDKKLISDQDSIALIKDLLDSIKGLHRIILTFRGSGKETVKDELFYGEYDKLIAVLDEFTPLYDKVRNYLTQKPYSEEKKRIYFGIPTLLNGFDINKESDYASAILCKDNNFFIAVLLDRKALKNIPTPNTNESTYRKVIYKQIPNSSKYISSKQILPQSPPEDIKEILLKKKKDNKSLTNEEATRFIDYVVNDFFVNYKMLIDNNGKSYFDFKFRAPSEYKSLNDFFEDVDRQAYSINYQSISSELINDLINKGKILLFRIYSKDFSKDSKGKPNLHTLYWRILFSEENRNGYPFRLNGGAEVFYRKASLQYSDEIMQKGHHYDKLKDKFSYPIIKNRRYTQNKYSLHVPITINAVSEGVFSINNMVNDAIRREENINIIGIDRGERNLLYISVIDSMGHILEQRSLNVIGDSGHEKDYQQLLADRERARQESRQGWKPVEGIKNLKEGYLSQVVHIIAKLMIKYNAVLFMEDLNAGMKHSRVKFEKQVYDKFENALVSKLCFYVDKEINQEQGVCAEGGLMKAYQLANVPGGKKDRSLQNGFIFYIPAWNTSKIDPVTGFVNLFNLNLTSKQAVADFFGKFKDIRYNNEKDHFEFSFDYRSFKGDNQKRCGSDYRNVWTVCTHGKRIREFRDPKNNSQWTAEEYYPTEKMKELLENNGISINSETLKEDILSVEKLDFYKDLLYIFRLTLQMRNSKPNSTKPEDDYIISPVADRNGVFYDSREQDESSPLPRDADANGAYNIARKGLWVIRNIRESTPGENFRNSIKNSEWLELAQKEDIIDGGTDSDN